jgi:hypothetical protein
MKASKPFPPEKMEAIKQLYAITSTEVSPIQSTISVQTHAAPELENQNDKKDKYQKFFKCENCGKSFGRKMFKRHKDLCL